MSRGQADRRLAKLEGALCPKAAVLLWLTEAHAFPTLPAYVGSLLDHPRSKWPLKQIAQRVEAAVRAGLRGGSAEPVETAVRTAVRDAFFLFELVEHVNLETLDTVNLQGLRLGLLTYQMRCLELEGEIPEYRDHPYAGLSLAERWQEWREELSGFLLGLYETAEARLVLERRYLDGHAFLFPELAADWETLLERAEGLAGVVGLLPAAEGHEATQGRGKQAKSPDLDLDALRTAARAKAPAGAACLVDTARCATLDLLGDTKAAVTIVERRLRASGP